MNVPGEATAGEQGFGGFSSLSLRQAAIKGREKDFWRLVKIGFSSRRKTLANNLIAGYRAKPSDVRELLQESGFTDKTRAQELSVEDWVKLFKENC